MGVYIVTYDLNEPGQDYSSLLKAIRSYTHCHALKSAFFIDTPESASEVRDYLKQCIDRSDVLFVMALRKHWACNTSTECTSWLKDDSRTWA